MFCILSSVSAMLMSNVRTNVLKAIQESVWFSILRDFCKPVIVHSICRISLCSSADFGPFYVLDVADVANAFVADSIPRNVPPVMHLKFLISIDLKRLLVVASVRVA
jgi:hypothetical protein